MRNKIPALSLLTIFSLIVLTAFASAASSLNASSISYTNTTAHNAGSFSITFNLNNTGSTSTVNWTTSITSGTVTSVSGLSNGSTVTNSSLASQTATLSFPSFQTGSIGGTITATPADGGTAASIPFTVTIQQSASLSLSNIKAITRYQNGTVNITNTGNTALTNVNLTSSGDFSVTFSSNNIALSAGSSTQVNVLATTDVSTLKFGTGTLTVTGTDLVNGTSASATFSALKTFCSNGTIGNNLSLQSISISSSGSSTTDWKLLDKIKVEVDVENNGGSTIRDVQVKMGLFSSSGTDRSSDLIFTSSDDTKINLGDIADGDSKTHTFEFKVPVDMNTGSYKLAVKTYSSDVGEDSQCDDTSGDLDTSSIYESIDVDRQTDRNKFIIFSDDPTLSASTFTCGDTGTLSFSTYNIGDTDENKVKIQLVNTELGINSYVERTMDRATSTPVSLSFDLPKNLSNKVYNLLLSALSDYRSSDYHVTSNLQKTIPVTITGCANTTSSATKLAAVSATLDSEAQIGKELVISTTVTNLASTSTAFTLDVTNFDSWAKLNSISATSFILAPGESKTVTITFDVSSSASEGEHTFTIETSSGDKLESKEVAVNIAKSSFLSSLLPSSLSKAFGENSSLIWIVGAVNLVLIIVIVVVAVKVARRPKVHKEE